MAKIIHINTQCRKEPDFDEFQKKLSKEQLELLNEFNIRNHEDMAALAVAMGVDMEKMLNFRDKHPDVNMEDVPFEQFMMDEDHPLYHKSVLAEDDYEDDSMCLPEYVFIGVPKTEYHIRIKLKNAPLPIWRELKVPSNITLEVLSCIIIEAMGWKNIHLHKFKKGNILFMDTDELEAFNN